MAAAPGATIYHSRSWAEILQRTFGYQPRPRLFRFDDGTVALLPAMRVGSRSSLWQDLRAVPSGYGAPISDRPLTARQRRQLWRAITEPCATAAMLSVRFGPGTEPAWPELGSVSRLVRTEQRSDFTHALDLRLGFDALWTSFHKHVRYYHGRGLKDGLSVRSGTTAEDVDRFYPSYEHNSRAWPAHDRKPRSLFHNMVAAGAARVWLVEDAAGATLGGAVLLEFGASVHVWAAARDPRLDNRHPVHRVLYPEMIRDACERGFSWFDFGSSQAWARCKISKSSSGRSSWITRYGTLRDRWPAPCGGSARA